MDTLGTQFTLLLAQNITLLLNILRDPTQTQIIFILQCEQRTPQLIAIVPQRPVDFFDMLNNNNKKLSGLHIHLVCIDALNQLTILPYVITLR